MHNFKKVLKTFLVLVVCVALLAALDLALYPCTFMRNDVHAVVTQQFDDIIVGTSHGKMDIDPEVMQEVTGRSGHNLCVGGEYGIDAYYLTKLIKEKQNPKRIIYEVDPGYFVSEKKEITTCFFIMSFHFQKQRWNISGILLRNVISVLCFSHGMNILSAMNCRKSKIHLRRK